MMQVELSMVPFPEEPPIVYPDPEFWEKITREREKYKAVDLGHSRVWIADDLDFAPLHGNPEFEALVADPQR